MVGQVAGNKKLVSEDSFLQGVRLRDVDVSEMLCHSRKYNLFRACFQIPIIVSWQLFLRMH